MPESTDAQLDALYDRIDDMLLAGDFAAVDREIAAVDIAATDLTMLLGWLTITYAAREHLPARERFAVQAFMRVEREQGAAEALKLIDGLLDDRPLPPMPIPLLWPEEEPDMRALRRRIAASYRN